MPVTRGPYPNHPCILPPSSPQALKDRNQLHLLEKLTKNLGFGMGLEFRESANVLSGKNDGTVRAGMVFNVCIGAAGLENPAAKDNKSKVGLGGTGVLGAKVVSRSGGPQTTLVLRTAGISSGGCR